MQDREHARSLFLTPSGEPTPLHTAFLSAIASGAHAPSLVAPGGAKTFEPGVEATEAAAAGKAGRLLTREEKERVRKAIEGAESVEEVRFWPCSLVLSAAPSRRSVRTDAA